VILGKMGDALDYLDIRSWGHKRHLKNIRELGVRSRLNRLRIERDKSVLDSCFSM